MKAALCKVADIPAQGSKQVDFFGREVLVFMDQGKPKAVLNYCLHLGGPLKLEGNQFVCQWHGAAFACADGKCVKGPARPESRLMIVPTRVEQGVLTYVYGE